MSEILEYKCPSCAAPLKFDGEKQNMNCDSCGNNFSTELLQEYDEILNNKDDLKAKWENYRSESINDVDNMNIYSCTSCGAEIVGDETTAATHCLYCNSPAIITNKLSGMYRPDYVIPFKTGKPDAKAAILKLCKGKLLLPKGFKDENHIEEIKGIYVPFWLFDCGIYANIDFRATHVTSWHDSKYNYTKTNYYAIKREGNLDFTKVPVDGSEKIDNKYMESIEPFNYDEAVDFQTAYLSGYLANKYDVDSEDCKERANQRIKNSTISVFKDTIDKMRYTTITPNNTNVQIDHGKIHYALFPVWMLNTKYKDKVYTFIMNGQTGKFIGELPVSMKKFFAWFTGLTAGFTVIASIIAMLWGAL